MHFPNSFQYSYLLNEEGWGIIKGDYKIAQHSKQCHVLRQDSFPLAVSSWKVNSLKLLSCKSKAVPRDVCLFCLFYFFAQLHH